MKLPSALTAILAAAIALFLYSRAPVLYLFYSNAPSRIARTQNVKNLDTKFADVVRNCEDVMLDAHEGFVLLSCDPGRGSWNTVMGPFVNSTTSQDTGLYLWHYADNNAASRPEKLKLLDFGERANDFHPLGIDYHSGSQTLFVANHAGTGSRIEVFMLFSSEFAATHVRTLEGPHLAAPNAIAALSETELIVTNDHYFRRRNRPVLSLLETYLGVSGGSVVYVDLDSSAKGAAPSTQVLTRIPFANGIVLLNATTVAIASSSMASVYLYSLERDTEHQAPSLTHARRIPVPFLPDNLSVDADGKLLIAGHPHAPTLEKVAKNSARCNAPGMESKEGCDFRGLSWLSEWSEDGGLTTLYVGDGFATSSTVVRDVVRKMGLATGLYERGILIWEE